LAKPKEIKQLTLEGDFVGEYESAAEAGRWTGFSRVSISDAANGKRKDYAGFKWEWV